MIGALDQLELVRLDYRWRGVAGPFTGLRAKARRRTLLLMLLSEDGHERERAVREIPLSPAAAGLIVVRCGDWVWQVRSAAVARVEADFGTELLVELLPLVERVAGEWARGDELDALVDRLLDADALVAALDRDDPRVRRGAWRRLLARETTSPELLARGFADPDTRVRSLVARVLPDLPPDERRRFATRLLADPLGKLAAGALDALVELDGPDPIPTALTARGATLRNRARDWAAVHDVDARAVYLARLRSDPADAIAVVALAEIADRRDLDLIRHAVEDPRGYVRAAGLRALAALDEGAGRTAAVEALLNDPSGRVTRAAARVLRATRPFETDLARLTEAALDPRRSPRRRLRVIGVLRRFRWRHLAVVLEARRAGATGELRDALDQDLSAWLRRSATIGHGPNPELRASIELGLPTVDGTRRRAIEFVLRTASG